MFIVTVNVPMEKFALIKAKLENLTDAEGPLVAVGEYVMGPWMQALFSSSGKGTWAAVLRGGDPLRDTGELAGGFVHTMGADGKSVVITNRGRLPMIQWVQNFGMTIKAKNVPFLRFKIPGWGWVSKKQVTIPARSFFIWLQELRDNVVAIAKTNLYATVVEQFR